MECSFTPCNRPFYAKSLCKAHYKQQYAGRPLTEIREYLPRPEKCALEGCKNKPLAKGWCTTHYHQILRGEEPHLSVTRSPRGTGCIDAQGYRRVPGNGHPNSLSSGTIKEHILVMSETIGRPLLKGESVHHKNGVRHDNRPENLELWVTHQPSGQRPEDLVEWAHEVLRRYAKEA